MPPPPDYADLLIQRHIKGLTESENTVALRWLRDKGMLYDKIDFNVPLGPKVDFQFEMTDDQRRHADFLYASKADIVAYLDADVTIIEVKWRLTKGATGQLAHYAYWYRQQHPEARTISARAIAAYTDPGIAEATLAQGIDIELYGDAA